MPGASFARACERLPVRARRAGTDSIAGKGPVGGAHLRVWGHLRPGLRMQSEGRAHAGAAGSGSRGDGRATASDDSPRARPRRPSAGGRHSLPAGVRLPSLRPAFPGSVSWRTVGRGVARGAARKAAAVPDGRDRLAHGTVRRRHPRGGGNHASPLLLFQANPPEAALAPVVSFVGSTATHTRSSRGFQDPRWTKFSV